jgi:hypothetical protein
MVEGDRRRFGPFGAGPEIRAQQWLSIAPDLAPPAEPYQWMKLPEYAAWLPLVEVIWPLPDRASASPCWHAA